MIGVQYVTLNNKLQYLEFFFFLISCLSVVVHKPHVSSINRKGKQKSVASAFSVAYQAYQYMDKAWLML